MDRPTPPQPMPLRSVHLDFHTGPAIPDVGADFDPQTFAATFRDARVRSVAVFAKCHHGHLYYDTTRPERHPNLVQDLDLLGEQIEALHAVGILAPVYLSVQVDEFAADTHPEWVALDPEGRQVKWATGRFAPGWQILDMSSPYQEYVADQLADVLSRLGTVDGIFLDMCWDQESSTRWAVQAMRRDGLDPADPGDRARHARAVAHRYMARFRDMVLPRLSAQAATGLWFNSRPKTALPTERAFVDHVEIEALPTGGWGYSYLPYVARFVRPLGLPTLAHTGRFHKSWGDNAGLKPAAALRYECCQMLMYGLTAGIGDLLHPRGVPNLVTYRLIGEAYAYLERCEPFVAGGRHVSEVAVVMDPALGDTPGPVGVGLVRALQQLRQQFDVVGPDADLSRYRLVVVPETNRITGALAAGLSAFVAAGGALLVSGAAAVSADAGDDGRPAMAALGLAALSESPYSHTFLRGDGFDHVMYERSFQLVPGPAATVLVELVEPYFERTWEHFSGHDYTPPAGPSGLAAVVQHGNVITIGAPIFTAYGRHAPDAYLTLLADCFDRLLPDPVLRAGGPRHLETAVVDTPTARVVHLLSYLASRQAEGRDAFTREPAGIDLVHDPFPLVGVQVEIRSAERPATVTLQPHGRALPFEYADATVRTTVDILDGHGMIVLDRG